MANQSIEILAKVLEQSAKLVEEQVDAQLSKFNEMDEDDLERLKERRLEALKKAQKQKQVRGMFFLIPVKAELSEATYYTAIAYKKSQKLTEFSTLPVFMEVPRIPEVLMTF